MKEFAQAGNTPQKQFFEYRLLSARMVVECAFKRLKARFGILQGPINFSMDIIPTTIHACFVLHNFCEMYNESISDDQTRAVAQHDQQFQPRAEATAEVHNNERGGKTVRSVFTKYFESNNCCKQLFKNSVADPGSVRINYHISNLQSHW